MTWAYVNHKNIMQLMGVFFNPENQKIPELISPWMVNNTLEAYVNNNDYLNECRVKRMKLVS
jgi:hypothetical protein